MRTTDPFDFLAQHRDTIFRVLGICAALLVAFLLLRLLVRRHGGWGAAWRKLRYECAVTAHAFAAPVRAWLEHRRSLRLLVRGLGAPATWRDAERALAAARQAGRRPYAALVDADTVTVLLAGREPRPPEDGPWWVADDETPDHWRVARDDLPPVVPDPGQVPPVLVAIGEADGRCAFLDVATGPATLCATGDERCAVALHQAVAAQLDRRLPVELVIVAEGVHRAFAGLPVRTAYRQAEKQRPLLGIAPVLVTAELPDPVPPALAAPPGDFPAPRLLLLGEGRGCVRTLLTDRHGGTALVGTPLVVAGNALSRAIARVLAEIPPVLPPAPPAARRAGQVHAFAEQEDESAGEGVGEGVSEAAWTGNGEAAAAPPPPAAEAEAEDEPEAAPAPAPAPTSARPPAPAPALAPEDEDEPEAAPAPAAGRASGAPPGTATPAATPPARSVPS